MVSVIILNAFRTESHFIPLDQSMGPQMGKPQKFLFAILFKMIVFKIGFYLLGRLSSRLKYFLV